MRLLSNSHKKLYCQNLLSYIVNLLCFALLFECCQQHANAAEMCRIENHPFAIPCGVVKTSVMSSNLESTQRSLTLRYYQVPAKVRYPKPEPILWIPDGIAQYATDRAPAMMNTLSRLRNSRDFIWLETRSTGLSAIGCQDTEVTKLTDNLQRYRDPVWLNDCKGKLDRFGGAGVLSYAQIAADYERLLTQLNIKQVMLVVEGRGYEVYRAWLKLAPHRFKAVIIDSPIIIDADAIKRRHQDTATRYASIVERCRVSAPCQQTYTLEENPILTLSQGLPKEIHVIDPLNGQISSMMLDEEILISLFTIAISQPSRAAMVIKAIDQAKQGQWQLFFNLAGLSTSRRLSRFEHGSNLVEQCRAYPQTTRDAVQNGTHSSLFNTLFSIESKKLIKLCDFMGLNRTSKVINTHHPFNSITPTLVLRGELNQSTSFNDASHQHLKQVLVPNTANPILGFSCARDVLYYFIKQVDEGKTVESMTLDSRCLTSIQPYPLPLFELGLAEQP